MTTSQTIIDRATSILKVREAGISFVDDDASGNSDAFIALQDMIAQWSEDNRLQIPTPSLVTDALNISRGTVRALSYNLAVEMESDFGANLTQTAFIIANDTKNRLIRRNPLDLSADLSGVPSGRGARYNIETDS